MSKSIVDYEALEARSRKLAERDACLRSGSNPQDETPLDPEAVLEDVESTARERALLLADYQAAFMALRREFEESRQRDLEDVIELRQKVVEIDARAHVTTVLLRKTEKRLMKALSERSDSDVADVAAKGCNQTRKPGTLGSRVKARRLKLCSNPLFDSDFYLASYPDVRASGKDPFAHFLEFGAIEGRNPNRMFDSKWYLEMNPDVEAAGVNPLLHYHDHGSRERRDPHPLFLTKWYLRNNPDLNESIADPLAHYLAQNERRTAKQR